jgi:multidrug efflux pump subunit AcrB
MELSDKRGKTVSKKTRLQRLSLWSFNRPRRTALIWLVLVVFGATCYGTLLKREGFPSVNTPFATASGSYLVNDPAKVDNDVAKPLSNFLLKQNDVKTVQTQSSGNFYTAIVSYQEKVNANTESNKLSKQISDQKLLPAQATLKFAPYEFGFTQRGDDLVVAFYSNNDRGSSQELVAQATKAAAFIRSKNLPLVHDASVINPYEMATNPLTGLREFNQKSFDRFGQRQGEANTFHTSAVIGVQAEPKADNLELDKQVRSAVSDLNSQPQFKGYHATISASYAPQINEQISTLQTSLLEGLLAVLIIGSLVIAVRASIVTVLSMITVLAIVNGLLYLFGYSLNTITLFALILGLSLIVDDTIIMVEALDVQRRRQEKAGEAVSEATRRVSRAMIAATSTSVLSFAPLLFVGGILGGFIRAIPVTIISALLTSLFVALVFIPFFARFLLLRKQQMGERNVREFSRGIEAAIARFVSGPMLWAKGSTKKLISVGLIAVFIGLGFIGAGGYLFSKVTFNIFPPSKDGNQLSTVITFKPNTNIEQAQATADQVDKIITDTLGPNFVRASYFGQADIQTANMAIDITDYKDRDVTAPQLVGQLNHKFGAYKGASVEAAQLDAGPPSAAFTIQVASSKNRQGASRLADDISTYLGKQAVLKRPDGSIAKVGKVSVGNSSVYTRTDNKQYITVDAKFIDTDTSTLVTLAKDAVKKEFPPAKVASYGLPRNAISYDAGQEDENQNSFKTLAIAFPILLVVIYVVLSFQFRSLLQPALIFMAIPFSLFGITLGLYLTHNAFSFFAMLGFFALIGLSIKNTILLTDFANQSRAAGLHPVDAAHEALAERFRPLIATSLTAVFSLIPLALSSPFWEGLAVVLIFGLLSSTFLVITVFPYYYLGSEFLRMHFGRRTGLGWFILTIAFVMVLVKAAPLAAILSPFLAALVIKLVHKLRPARERA